METKEIDVTCPCCRTLLTVDVRTGAVLRSARAEEVDDMGRVRLGEERWDQAAERVRKRSEGVTDRLEEGLTRERDKERRLDDLFDQAQKKLGGDEEGEGAGEAEGRDR